MSLQKWPGIIWPVALLVALESLTAQDCTGCRLAIGRAQQASRHAGHGVSGSAGADGPAAFEDTRPARERSNARRDGRRTVALAGWPAASLGIVHPAVYQRQVELRKHRAVGRRCSRNGAAWMVVATSGRRPHVEPARRRGSRIAAARQTAMRSLARKLEASEVRRGESFPLRLLDRPIYTYADEKHGVLGRRAVRPVVRHQPRSTGANRGPRDRRQASVARRIRPHVGGCHHGEVGWQRTVDSGRDEGRRSDGFVLWGE